ncbi:MAG: hypothetical protein GWN37_12555 [Gammaproteobacteria bacterium]|nr:hypothetical protein [Gammaproteobacteria bacterium]
MKFVVFRCTKDRDYFVVTDEPHAAGLKGDLCPSGGELERLGEFAEMGERRVAFNEALAKDAIKRQGYYRFEAKTFDPVAQAPGTMPG